MKDQEASKKERANKMWKEANRAKETKIKEVEEDKKNSETAEEKDQSKNSYKDAASLRADGPNKGINDHLIDMIPGEDTDVSSFLGAEHKVEEVQTPQRKKNKKDKRKDKKDRKGDKAKAESIIRPGRFLKSLGGGKCHICMTPKLQHLYVHSRVSDINQVEKPN